MTTYPYPAYPGFRHPEDWREIQGDGEDIGTSNDRKRAWIVTDDAVEDHEDKHQHRDHPWCHVCSQRRVNFEEGFDPLPDPVTAEQEMRRRLQETVNRTGQNLDGGTYSNLSSKLYIAQSNDIFFSRTYLEQIAAQVGVDVDVVDAMADYTVAIHDWEHEAKAAKNTCHRRVVRHLVLHRGTLPIDTYDPDAENQDDDAGDYLDRDQLRELPVPEPLIDGVLTRHTYSLLIGRDHTFKSFTALDWALCLATGKSWQGKAVESARVLYIAAEGVYGITKRVDAWEYAWGRKVDPARFTVRKAAVNLHRGGQPLERLLTRLTEGGYDLVVIDTLRRSSGGADGNSTDMGLVVDNLERIKRATDAGTVLVIAHTDKGDNDARGFSGIEDDADTVWHAKADEFSLTLTNTKQKDQAEHPPMHLHMLVVPEHDSLVIECARPGDETGTESEALILETMRDMFSETGATSTEILDATGMAKSTFYRARNRLLRARLMVNAGTKARARYEINNGASPTELQASDLQLSHLEKQWESEGPPVPPIPTDPQASDLHVSHQSHLVPAEPGVQSHESHPL